MRGIKCGHQEKDCCMSILQEMRINATVFEEGKWDQREAVAAVQKRVGHEVAVERPRKGTTGGEDREAGTGE